jgi:hypothetical protein
MVRFVKDFLAQSARETFVGRTTELEALSALLDNGPRVIFLHGIVGVGKSALLAVFAERARAQGASVISLDCRAIEPTERGFLHELSAAIGGSITRLSQAPLRLRSLGPRVLLSLDNYEVFRLMDTWLRQVFIPLLPDNVSVLIVGRDTPVHSWLTAPGWQGLVRIIALGALNEHEAIKLLVSGGTSEAEAKLINRFALGHPLALKLASMVAMETHGTETALPALGFQRVFEELMRLYLADVHDPITRRALDAASVVRRITVSLLQAMLPDAAPQDAFERLQALPFVEHEHDGLRLHDLVQQAIATSLRAIDPNRYQEYRRSAWQQLSAEARRTGSPGLWRYTADLLYMIENPVVREAFFPGGGQRFIVEPARADDGPAILDISELHESGRGAESIEMWWSRVPQAFHVVRDEAGNVAGFYLMFDPATIDPMLLQSDAIVERWWAHLTDDPVPDNQRVLFLRRWLSREEGERPCSVQAACWLDIKRAYMEMRPLLRRVYLTLRDLSVYAPVAQRLCFQPLAGETNLSGTVYTSAMLDFGPSSVDGWLSVLGAAELGVEEEMLDPQAHELMLDGKRVKLTKLEFEVFQYLYQRKGVGVSRASLIEDVWGWKHTGSNVVEAVVRSLRKKLGDRSSSIETIRGLGYRFRNV